jgi:hypothetical protein
VAPSGSTYQTIQVNLGSDFQASNICYGITIFGLAGTAVCSPPSTQSNANRTNGTTQLSQVAEVTTYAGVSLPSTGGYSYREGADIFNDDDGAANADEGCVASCTSVVSITAAQHAAFTDCGLTQSTILTRIADCASKNGSNATWDGGTQSNSGDAVWKLVTRHGANKEVWQDQRTGLLWSSIASTTNKWCPAAGNNDASDPSGYCNANTTSYCIETLYPGGGAATPGFSGDSFIAGTYDAAKGGMGRGSTPSVDWRLPTIHDYDQAEVDGIRHVMPDMGAFGSDEWSSTISSANRAKAWEDWTIRANITTNDRFANSYNIRCVGH